MPQARLPVSKYKPHAPGASGSGIGGTLGVGCLERGSCLLASPPGVGAPLLELYASAARPRDKAGAGQAARIRGGARAAALGGVWQLGAAGCCKRRGEHVRALGCVPSAVQRTFPCASRGRLCSSGRALSQRATGLQNRPLGRQRRRTAKTSGTREVQLQVARAAKCSIKRSGLSARSLGTCSDPPSRTLSVERESKHS